MHIAYSALRTKPSMGKGLPGQTKLSTRQAGYLAACNKYRAEIAAIQKQIPGWMPPFEMNG